MPDQRSLSALSAMAFQRAKLHHEGLDQVVADVQYGGPPDQDLGIPGDPTDRRLILDRATLQHLLDVASGSITGRVVIHHAGVRVRQHRTKEGHLYEIVYMIGGPPVAEGGGILNMLG